MSTKEQRDSYLVVGGCGFLGQHIVRQLIDRGELEVAVFDIVQRELDSQVRFFSGDITERVQVVDAIRKCNVTSVIHCASPIHGLGPEIYQKVNVQGTKTLVDACIDLGVNKLIYTSSAGVVFDGHDLMDVDERMPFPEKPMDAYNATKVEAEKIVLEANGKGSLKTVALRPAGIFGPGERQFMTHLTAIAARNQSHFQIGDNTNLFDWTYVGNVAYAHLLASDKLSPSSLSSYPLPVDSPILAEPKPIITLSTACGVDGSHHDHPIPTSLARPLGPSLSPTKSDEDIAHAFYSRTSTEPPPPVTRSRYDQFSPAYLNSDHLPPSESPLQIAGQAFFITNGEPLYFWDFMRTIWHRMGHTPSKRRIVFPKALAMPLAFLAECVGWVIRKDISFTRFRVKLSCATRWYNIEKARRVLGYEPQVGVEQGIEEMVKWWNETGSKASVAH